MIKNIFIFVITLVFSTGALAQKTKAAPYLVTQQSVEQTLKFLSSDELKGRNTGSEGAEKAARFLEELFVKNSVKPYFSTYRDTLSNFDKPAFNIVGYIEGTDKELKKEFVIISAHYDHIGTTPAAVAGDSIFNGADDNASGCTAVAEMVNYFAKSKSNKRSIMFCFFSGEEKGLLGSRHLAAKLKKQDFNLYAMVNFEMIGVPLGKDIQAYITGYSRSNMADKMNEYAGSKIIGYTDFEVRYQLFRASDNFPFFNEFNVPAHTLSTTDMETFKFYHNVKDDYAAMDTAHMASFIKLMFPVTEKLVNAKTKEIVLKK